MKTITSLIALMLISISISPAQKEANNWYFGFKAGITFNTHDGVPVALTDGAMKGGTYPGSISDKNGKLLFYTDGKSAWNQYHQQMPNGNYNFSCSRLFILTHPGNDNIYYIFSIFYNFNTDSLLDFQYTTVDMSLQGGLGDVVSKNNFLLESDIYYGITAIRHSNNRDVWVITASFLHEFQAYLLTDSGIIGPVKSNTRSDHEEKISMLNTRAYNIKASPDGCRIAGRTFGKNIYLYFFDNTTGVVSKPITLHAALDGAVGGIEFSPDATKLYYTLHTFSGANNRHIFQIDLQAGSPDDISSSYVKLWSDKEFISMRCLELGPDGKIYVPRIHKTYLGAVNNPNISGTGCNYVDSAVSLAGRVCGIYLPKFLHSCFYILNISSNSPLCEGETLYLRTILNGNISEEGYEWTGPNNFFSTEKNPVIPDATPDMEGVYKLKATISGYGFKDSVIVKELYVSVNPPPEVAIAADGPTTFCEGDSVTLSVSNYDSSCVYIWSTGDTASKIVVRKYGYYTLTAINHYGCKDSAGIAVYILKPPNVRIEADGPTSLCEGDSVGLKALPSGSEYAYSWSTGETTQEITVKTAGDYSVIVEDAEGCRDTASITIKVGKELEVDIKPGGIVTACRSDTVTLIALPSGSACKYEWSTGETTQSVKVIDDGEYWVIVTITGKCSGSDTVLVEFYELPEVSITPSGPTIFCEGGSVVLSALPEGDEYSYLWSTSSTLSEITVEESGTYTLLVEVSEGCRDSASIIVTVNPLPEVNIIGETVFCEGGSLNLDLLDYDDYNDILWSTGEKTNRIIVTQPGEYWVEATDTNGCTGTSEPVEISEAPNPEPVITGAAPICEGDTITISVERDYEQYLWNTGETTKAIEIQGPGLYFVEVTDANGCTGTVYANIELIEIELSGLENVSFGAVLVLNEAQSSLTVSNDGEDAVKIESVGIKGIEGAVFTLETTPGVPVTLEPGESIAVTVKFKPNSARVFLDSLIIEITEPCVESRSAACIGSGYELDIESTVRLPELTGTIGDPDFHISLYAKLDSDTIFYNLSYTAKISFDAKLFLPKGITKGNISGSSIAGGERTLVINGFEESLDAEEKILTEIYGLILLGDKDETPLRFDDFSFSDDMPVNKIDGRLRVKGVCIQSLSAIRVFTPTNMAITPNPAGEEVEVKVQTEEEGKFSINIYTIQGIKVETNEWVKTSGGKEEFIINLRIGDYPNGLYQAVLKTPSHVVSSQMVIVK